MSWESSSDDRLSKNPRDEPDAMEVAEASGYASPSDDEQPEVDDGTLSEVFQQPIKAAGDLSEGAKSGVPSERELLLQMLWRLGRIEEQLEKGESQVPPSRERRSLEDMFSVLIDVLRRMEHSSDEISDLRKRVGRIEDNSRSSSVKSDFDTSIAPAVPPGEEKSTPIDPTLPKRLPESSR